MLTITLTKESINYDKLVAYLEENKEHRLKMLNDKNIRDLSYAFDDETLIENIIYWDGMVGKAEYNRLTFKNDYDINYHMSLDECLKQQIIDMKSYLYILYDTVWDGDETNVILRGLVTGLNKAKAREEHIFATVPDRISELTIYTEIDNDDPWGDDSWDEY
jgi:hypothetical protein|nr:MAG TPA: hypothetical protein [Caudoviricetes sp.]